MKGKRAVAAIVTAALLGGAVWFSRQRRAAAPEEPEAVVWRMLDASRAGKVDDYLDCFTGGMRRELETTARGMSPPKFSDYLRSSVARVKGVAVYDLQRPSDSSAQLVVEYVYQEENERQRMRLRMEQGLWRIENAEASQRIQPLIPYGKPVTEVQ